MNKFKITVAALLMMCAISVVAASAASAVTFLLAEWLAAGAAITTAQATDQEGELELEDSKVLGLKVVILCSGILDGTVSGNGTDEITKLLSLAGVDAGEPLVGPGVTCTNTANCGGTPLVWAKKLPWKTAAELMIDGPETFFVDLIINSDFEYECTILGTKVTDEWTSPQLATELTNEAGGIVDVRFSDPFQELAGLTLGTATIGGTESVAITGLLSLLLTSGTALTVSSE
jgi:hypothetical protein